MKNAKKPCKGRVNLQLVRRFSAVVSVFYSYVYDLHSNIEYPQIFSTRSCS